MYTHDLRLLIVNFSDCLLAISLCFSSPVSSANYSFFMKIFFDRRRLSRIYRDRRRANLRIQVSSRNYSVSSIKRNDRAPEYPSGNWIRQLPALCLSASRFSAARIARSEVAPVSLSDTYSEEDARKMLDAARGD